MNLKVYRKNSGFTLVEMLLVISIIGILSGLVIAVINPNALRARARDSQRVTDLKKVQTALELYFADNRRYPIQAATFVRVSTSLGALSGAYYNGALPTDPKGWAATYTCGGSYDYNYKTTASGSSYVLVARMETNAVDYAKCNNVSNCLLVDYSCNCSTYCHAVQNPL